MAGNRIEIQVVGDTKDLERALGRATKSTQSNFQRMGKAAKIGGLAIAAGLAVAVKRGIERVHGRAEGDGADGGGHQVDGRRGEGHS